MDLKMLTPSDEMWRKVRDYAENCSWRAGRSLASAMDNNIFTDWERVIALLDHEKICGYCTVAKTDCIPDVSYTPYIGYLFVGEEYRGNRLSQKLIQYAMDYLKSIGFDKVHIVSDHENLYEKYGFDVIDRKMAPWGSEEKIYMQAIKNTESEERITLCGDSCMDCPRYHAHSENELRAVAELWYRVGWRDRIVSNEEIQCTGCFSHKDCTYHLIDCTRKHQVKKCNQCAVFPCDKIYDMLKRTDEYKEKCKEVCSAEEYIMLEKAFFNKENNLRK